MSIKLTLSNLSTEEQMVLNMSLETPHTSKMPSRICLWFTFTTNLPTSSDSRISLTILTHSASGIMASVAPAMSKSWEEN